MTRYIEPYAFTVRPVVAYPHIYDAETKKFTPLSKAKPNSGGNDLFLPLHMHEVLDCITLAVEAGIVPSDAWLKFLFGTEKAFGFFLNELSEYDEIFRITDRWWTALAQLAGAVDEEGFISSQEIADSLREKAKESGQL